MSNVTSRDLLVLATGLFPDAGTLETALQDGGNGSANLRYEVDLQSMDDAAWGRLLAEILVSKTILTL